MQVRAAASPQEVREAARLLRPRSFWFKFFLANWYATLLCLVALGADANGLLHHRHLPWGPAVGLLAVGAALLGFSWYRWNARLSKAAAAAIERSGTLSLQSSGVQTTLATGASTFVPWSSFTKWREGNSVFVLSGKDGTAIVPIDNGNRESIRSLLKDKIN